MRIFNEEAGKSEAEIIVILKPKEVQNLLDALSVAINVNNRKTTWQRLHSALSNKAACY